MNETNLPITQELLDRLKVSYDSFVEELAAESSLAIGDIVSKLIAHQGKQEDEIVQALGNLEARLNALQEAVGIETVEYDEVSIKR